MPFYAWDCLTLQLKTGRDVSLVIKDENDMQNLLKFFAYEMKSLDGSRGSGEQFIEKESRHKSKTMTKRQAQCRVMKYCSFRFLVLKVR